MGNWGTYVYCEPQKVQEGNYRVGIVEVEEKQSKSGNDMIVVSLKLNGTGVTVKDYFVKNEFFNEKVSRFFDAFPVLKGENNEGDFNFPTWIGCVGAARFKTDDKGYLKVQYYLTPERAKKLPEWVGEMPERQTVTELTEESDDDIPF